jgi:telomere length regulation protein
MFDELKQNGLIALVASTPKIVAPYVLPFYQVMYLLKPNHRIIIEEYFLQMYSTNQRFVMLNALSFGARELAFGRRESSSSPLFPSRMLEGHKHHTYLLEMPSQNSVSSANLISGPVEQSTTNELSRSAAVIRRKQLRVQPMHHREGKMSSLDASLPVSFNQVAAEYFITPLISQLWSYLQEDHAREVRTCLVPHSYKGTGTGMILNPMVFSHFLRTLATLMHAAQHSPAYLTVLAPEILELSLTMGSRPITPSESAEPENMASVVSALLELTLVTLTGCIELDGARSLCLDHASLLLAAGEWADRVVHQLDAGLRFSGGGGTLEVTLIKNALGVAKQVSEIVSKWKGSIVDIF